MRDFADVFNDGKISREIVQDGLVRLEIDKLGLDLSDRSYLLAIIEKYEGGPVGLDTLGATLSEETDTIESVIEPYLIMEGFIKKTPRGRMVTRKAYDVFGMNYSKKLSVEDFLEE
jgi:Holliday junction DNA helicase RuvB